MVLKILEINWRGIQLDKGFIMGEFLAFFLTIGLCISFLTIGYIISLCLHFIIKCLKAGNKMLDDEYTKVTITGVTVHGPEEDYILSDNNNGFGICALLSKAGIESIKWQESVAFEGNNTDTFLNYKEKYQKETGNEFPPVYKIFFMINKEQLSDEETRQFWKKFQDERTNEDTEV